MRTELGRAARTGMPAPPTPGFEATVEPRAGDPGNEVELTAAGFRSNADVFIGFGQPGHEFTVIDSARANAAGRVRTKVEVPDWAHRERSYVFTLIDGATQQRAVTSPFIVGARGEVVQTIGQLTDEVAECPAVRTQDGRLFALLGDDLDRFQPGDWVALSGTLAQGATICIHEPTLNVHHIERHP